MDTIAALLTLKTESQLRLLHDLVEPMGVIP